MKWYVLEWTSSLNTIIKMYRKSTLIKGGRLYVPWFIDVIFVKNDFSFMEKMIFWRDFSALENTFIKKIFLFKSKTIILFESRIQVEKKLWFSCLGSTDHPISVCYFLLFIKMFFLFKSKTILLFGSKRAKFSSQTGEWFCSPGTKPFSCLGAEKAPKQENDIHNT